ncbi:KH domain-containing protein [Candidatus Saccharibacteria bacterium]|nr:KH domain-containing protein [Candidatus Saccharibacteria bacterium]
MAATEKDQVFVEYVVKALVDNPDKVELKRSIDDRGVLLELTVDPEDMGKVIGKAGATAKSIRTLLRVLSAKDDARYNLKITEPEGSEYVHQEKSGDEAGHTDDVESPETPETPESPKDAEAEEAQDALEAEEQPKEDTKAEEIKAKAREGLEDLDTDI